MLVYQYSYIDASKSARRSRLSQAPVFDFFIPIRIYINLYSSSPHDFLNTPLTTSHSSSPPPPVRQLPATSRIAACPRHFVPVTCIFHASFMAFVRFKRTSDRRQGKESTGNRGTRRY